MSEVETPALLGSCSQAAPDETKWRELMQIPINTSPVRWGKVFIATWIAAIATVVAYALVYVPVPLHGVPPSCSSSQTLGSAKQMLENNLPDRNVKVIVVDIKDPVELESNDSHRLCSAIFYLNVGEQKLYWTETWIDTAKTKSWLQLYSQLPEAAKYEARR